MLPLSDQPGVTEVYGRQLNIVNELWCLPADRQEHERMNLEHKLLTLKTGLFSFPEAVVPALGGEDTWILDVGSGSGQWVVDMANEFPRAAVVGLDLTVASCDGFIPLNCRFELDDMNEKMFHYRSKFNFVHLRGVGDGISDYNEFLHESFAMLKPGGVLLTVEWDNLILDHNKIPISSIRVGDPGFSALAFYMTAVRSANKSLAPLSETMAEPLKRQQCLLQDQQWEHKGSSEIYIPLGPWKEDLSYEEREAATLLQRNLILLCESFYPLLRIAGHPEAEVRTWISSAQLEIEGQSTRSYIRWLVTYATKIKVSADLEEEEA